MTARSLLCAALIAGVLATCGVAADSTSPIVGGWDLTLHDGKGRLPSWLGVTMKDGKLVGTFVGTGGGVSDVADLKCADGKIEFRRREERYEAKLAGDTLAGELTRKDGKKLEFVGRRFVAKPEAKTAPEWAEPIKLLNGKDLNDWELIRGETGLGNWQMEDGVLVETQRGPNIRTKATFKDFKLHVEFNTPPGGNSGVYLRGRYEIQVADDFDKPASVSGCGALYSRIAPSENATKKAGEWQAFDITLVGQRLTVVLNGKTIIDNKEVEGITGGAIDSNEYAPGPIYLQGDHTTIKYRNIVLTPTKASAEGKANAPAKERRRGARKEKAKAPAEAK